jgi:DNA replication protein DnaC
MKKIAMCMAALVMLCGCTGKTAAPQPDPVAQAAVGVAGIVAHTESAERHVQKAIPHANPTGKVYLNAASDEHTEVLANAAHAYDALQGAQRQVATLNEAIAERRAAYTRLEGRWYVRWGRQVQRRLKWASLRDLQLLEDFDFSFNSSIKKKQVYDLATCQFVREHRDVLWLGPPGVGKSFLIQAIGYEAVKAGFVVLYRSIFDLVRDFLHDEAFEGQEKVLAKYLKPDLLLIDDMGMKQLPRRSGECLFEVIMRRYERKSTMMTSNRPLEDWGKLIGDLPAATAILDRFLHHALVITITGKSYRLRNQSGDAPAGGQPEVSK